MQAPWRAASSPPGTPWPDDLGHHLPEPTGYSAGYAAYHHPGFSDGHAPNWWKAEEAYYVSAGGRGTQFEDGWEDASNGLPHQIDQPREWLDHTRKNPSFRKKVLDQLDEMRQREHNELRGMGDLIINERGVLDRSGGPSSKHPAGSWEGCPTCSPRKDVGGVEYRDPDDDVDPFDPRLIGASRRHAADRPDLRWERDSGGDWILVGRNPDGNPVAVRTERAPSVRTSAVDDGEERAWKNYEQGGNIGFLHDWWLENQGRNQGSMKSADDFLDYFRTERWARDGYQPAGGPAEHHMETQEEADEIFERRMEGDWGGPHDDDYDEDDEDLKDQKLNMGQGLMWMIKHQNEMGKLPTTDDHRDDPDEHLDPDNPRIKGARRRNT